VAIFIHTVPVTNLLLLFT